MTLLTKKSGFLPSTHVVSPELQIAVLDLHVFRLQILRPRISGVEGLSQMVDLFRQELAQIFSLHKNVRILCMTVIKD